MKILVIDDENIILALNRRILERIGFDVLTATDGYLGCDVFKYNCDSIPLVIIDMNMEGQNGIETARQIWNINGETNFILSSGDNCNPAEIPEEIKSRIYFLQKPFRSNQLTALVESIVVPF